MSLSNATISELRDLLDRKEISSVDVVMSSLDAIKDRNQELNAFLEVFDDVLDGAHKADKRIAEGNITPLTGIPIAVKDNILIHGKPASAASKILENYKATYDATVIKKLKETGALFMGRTNMDEFAMGSSSEQSAFGSVKNPHDITRVPGGSSGGSAVSVAAGLTPAALGSDTAGSIRQPASFCGVVGLKPTYGSVSRYGLIAMGSSLDVIGPIGKTVHDVEVLFDAIRGRDSLDATSADEALYAAPSEKEHYTVGVPTDFLKEGVDERVLAAFNAALENLTEKGVTVREIPLPNVMYALPVYYILMPAEASTNLARFDGIRYGLHKEGATGIEDFVKSRTAGFGPEPRRRILLGTYVLSAGYYDAYYSKAHTVRQLVIDDYRTAFEKVDAIATPTAPTPPFPIGEKTDPLSMYLQDIFTVPANLTGMPALSVPVGGSEIGGKKLPIGFQLMTPAMHEKVLFALGKQVLNEV